MSLSEASHGEEKAPSIRVTSFEDYTAALAEVMIARGQSILSGVPAGTKLSIEATVTAVGFPADAEPIEANFLVHTGTPMVLRSDRFSPYHPTRTSDRTSWLQYYALQIAKIENLNKVFPSKTLYGVETYSVKQQYTDEAKFILRHGKTHQQFDAERRQVLRDIGLVSLVFLAACAGINTSPTQEPEATGTPPPPPATKTVPPTETPVPATETPTNTPTPEPARPTADPNLSPENNAAMVLENSVWVVKNADGKVTATWDSAAGKWRYNDEILEMQVGMVLPKFVRGMGDSISETGTVNIPADMLKPLNPSQQDPNPLVPSGHYGDNIIQGTAGDQVTLARIGVDYRGIVFIDNKGFDDSGNLDDEYAVIFTVQDPNHPDVINVIAELVKKEAGDAKLTINLDPSGARHLGPTFAQFIAMLQAKNPVGRRMSIMVQTSTYETTEPVYLYSPDNIKMVNAIAAGKPIPEDWHVPLWAHDISIPYDLAALSK